MVIESDSKACDKETNLQQYFENIEVNYEEIINNEVVIRNEKQFKSSIFNDPYIAYAETSSSKQLKSTEKSAKVGNRNPNQAPLLQPKQQVEQQQQRQSD